MLAMKLFGKSERIIRRILIVEDEPLVAFDNEHFLSEAGYEVVATVDTLADARRVMDEQQVDLVLCDFRLRGEGNGADVARHAATKDMPVLYVSGLKPSDLDSLAIGFLAKPYNGKALIAALTTLDSHLAGKRIKRLPPGLVLFTHSNDAVEG